MRSSGGERSAFAVQRSPFSVRRSSFAVWRSPTNPDSQFGRIVLVVVLVLDPWDFSAEKRARSLGNYFVPSLWPRDMQNSRAGARARLLNFGIWV